jgi:glycosyltransferase involved in cell wall biosynthesis
MCGDQPTPRRWSVNGRFLSRSVTGVDRYALEILRAIDALIGEGHPLTAGLALDILCPADGNAHETFGNIPLRVVRKAPGHIWEQFILPLYLRGGLLSLCNTGPLIAKKHIVCIHDVNTRLAPESYSTAFRAAYRLLEPALALRARRIVTVSDFSRKTMVRFGISTADQIDVIYDGHEHALGWNPDRSSLDAADLPLPYVLLVGSKAPHKNVEIIFSIAADLANRGIHVLVTGGNNANVYAREQASLPANVMHLGRVNDDDLACLYRHALCLVFPSKTEGFGLPAVEAMALGCPVISTDAASLPEVCGEAVLYAPPDNAAAWLRAIDQVAGQKMLRKRLAEDGRKRSKLFSWRDGAEKYLGLMYAIDQADRGKPE